MSVSAIGSYGFIDRMVMSAMKRTEKSEGSQFDPSQIVADIIQKEDTDSDGALSASETTLSTEAFSSLDVNGDGKVTSDELLAAFKNGPTKGAAPPPPPPGAMDTSKLASNVLESEDANGDGILSIEETGLDSQSFGLIDTDGDGQATLSELQAAIEARQAEREREMAAMAKEGSQATSGAADALKSLLDSLAQNDASNAYSSKRWVTQMLQSSAAQNLTISG